MELRVCYDDRWTGGGIGRFSLELIPRLKAQGIQMIPIAINSAVGNPISPLSISRALNDVSANVFWSPGFMPPLKVDIPVVITVHDLIHRNYGGIMRRFYYDIVIRSLARKSSSIITVSEHSREMISRWLGDDAPSVVVVKNGVSESFTQHGARWSAHTPYVLYCGNQRSHKNLARMLEAYSHSTSKHGLSLLMTGSPEESTNVLIDRMGLRDKVFWLGDLDESSLAEAYRGATFLMLVSLEEGFGLPVVEAMACGTPVLTSNTSALKEIAGDAAVTVDPNDVQDITVAIERLAADGALRSVLRARGIERSKIFRWDKVAARVSQVFMDVVQT